MSKARMYRKSIHRTTLDGPLQGSPRMKVPFIPTPQNPLILSVSELGSFLRCRLQWNWRYRVGIVTKGAGRARINGIFVHVGKEDFYKLPSKKRTPLRMRAIAKTAISKVTEVKGDAKDRELAIAMLTGLAEWVREDHEHSDRAIGKRKCRTEVEFCIPLLKDGSILIRGKIDEVFEPFNLKDTLALDETKTKNQISFDMLEMSNQLTAYLWVLSVLYPGYKRYIAWRTVCRRQMPGPRVKARLFARESVERNEDELKMWLLDVRRIARDILDAAIYPNKTDSCSYDCDFYKLCLIRSNAHDLKAVIKSEYTTK